jgi:hypothetical protein
MAQTVEVFRPVGPLLRDCDDGSVLEADTKGDGPCDGDPELADHDGDGTRELPPGTGFAGTFAFRGFFVSEDVSLTTSGPLRAGDSRGVGVFGSLRLAGDTVVGSFFVSDLRALGLGSRACHLVSWKLDPATGCGASTRPGRRQATRCARCIGRSPSSSSRS